MASHSRARLFPVRWCAGGVPSKAREGIRKLKVLELFSGTRSIGEAFERRGHEVYSIDWDRKLKADWHVDIERVKAKDILKRFGQPDVIHLSPDCSSYSVSAISRHRRKNDDTQALDPVSEYARKCDRVNLNCMRLLRDLRPTAFWIENPRDAMRKMQWLQVIPRFTTCYCKYTTKLPLEMRRMKPSDWWTNIPDAEFIPPCKNGDPCHVRAPRGSTTGTQGMKLIDKYRIPQDLCDHIVLVTESFVERMDMANEFLASQGQKPITPHWGERNEPSEPQQQRLFS